MSAAPTWSAKRRRWWPGEPSATNTAAVRAFGLEREEALELYRRMRLIRRFEDVVRRVQT
jgi:TPP-dependent pyruvate/acetoin dehydrogenase alpha subunit